TGPDHRGRRRAAAGLPPAARGGSGSVLRLRQRRLRLGLNGRPAPPPTWPVEEGCRAPGPASVGEAPGAPRRVAGLLAPRPPLRLEGGAVVLDDVTGGEDPRGRPHRRAVRHRRDLLPRAPRRGPRGLRGPPHGLVDRTVVGDLVARGVDLAAHPLRRARGLHL